MLALPWIVACVGGGAPADEIVPVEVVSVRVEPESLELSTTVGEPATASFEAWATFDDGTERAINLVSWSVSNASAGDVTGDGVFTSVDSNGGSTLVTATHRGIEGSARVTVVYREALVESGVDEAVVAAFDAASATEDASVAFGYPSDGVTVPRNLDGFAFAWTRPAGANVSRIRFRSELTDLSVYAADDAWTSRTALWTLIAAANRSGTVSAEVTTGIWADGALSDVRTGPAIDLTVNRFDARGSVLYWATASRGILRIPFGETTATRFWPEETSNACIGCHTVVEDRDQMVVTHDGVNGAFTVVDVSDANAPRAVVDPADDKRMTFKTVSPDGEWMLGVTNGTPELYAFQTTERRSSPAFTGGRYTHPDWAPDGSAVVAVRATGAYQSDMGFAGGELVRVPWDGSRFGTPETLVAAEAGKNLYYPAYSPDGAYIAYNRSSGDSYADNDAEIWLLALDGSFHGPLVNANTGGTQNSYPRWGPLPDDDVLWLAYSSRRAYAPEPTNTPQIWVTAIDPSRAAAGEDPSATPFWLPGQDTRSDNHLPVWWSR